MIALARLIWTELCDPKYLEERDTQDHSHIKSSLETLRLRDQTWKIMNWIPCGTLIKSASCHLSKTCPNPTLNTENTKLSSSQTSGKHLSFQIKLLSLSHNRHNPQWDLQRWFASANWTCHANRDIKADLTIWGKCLTRKTRTFAGYPVAGHFNDYFVVLLMYF